MIDLPKPSAHSGSRPQALDLLRDLPSDLSPSNVAIDCEGLTVSTPSFWDEIVKEVLESRHARSLSVVGASQRVGQLAMGAARNRGVVDRLTVVHRNLP
jgi:hypothetical protein